MDKQDGGNEATEANVVIDTEPISAEGMKRSNRFPLPLDVEDLRCWQYFDAYISCHMPGNVIQGMYRRGEVGCPDNWYTFKTCALLKLKGKEKAQWNLDRLHAHRQHLEEDGRVWNPKQQPQSHDTTLPS